LRFILPYPMIGNKYSDFIEWLKIEI